MNRKSGEDAGDLSHFSIRGILATFQKRASATGPAACFEKPARFAANAGTPSLPSPPRPDRESLPRWGIAHAVVKDYALDP
jgi:hypothetical protein